MTIVPGGGGAFWSAGTLAIACAEGSTRNVVVNGSLPGADTSSVCEPGSAGALFHTSLPTTVPSCLTWSPAMAAVSGATSMLMCASFGSRASACLLAACSRSCRLSRRAREAAVTYAPQALAVLPCPS